MAIHTRTPTSTPGRWADKCDHDGVLFMSRLSDTVPEYCSSEHFLLLDSDLKEHAETLLAYWSEAVGDSASVDGMERALKHVARLDVPLESRKAFPEMLRGFLDYVVTTGSFREAERWSSYLPRIEDRYLESFRDDGSVKGETFRKKHEGVGRNDPCPCGSGKKFKKCCRGLLA